MHDWQLWALQSLEMLVWCLPVEDCLFSPLLECCLPGSACIPPGECQPIIGIIIPLGGLPAIITGVIFVNACLAYLIIPPFCSPPPRSRQLHLKFCSIPLLAVQRTNDLITFEQRLNITLAVVAEQTLIDNSNFYNISQSLDDALDSRGHRGEGLSGHDRGGA
jgi:hypothetical protein